MNVRKTEEYVRRLRRRERHLENRIDSREKLSYDIAERNTLSWIIQYVEDTLEAAAEHQAKWQEEKNEQNELS